MLNRIAANAVIAVVFVIVWVYSLVTYPIYAIIQRPWIRRGKKHKQRARLVPMSEGICYRKIDDPHPIQIKMEKKGLDTVAKVFNYACEEFSSHNALGTREILGEFDEKQKNGRVFKKFEMGKYNWLTFSEVYKKAKNFGRGLCALDAAPKKNVLIFSETREEFFMAVMGAFQQSCTICTLYATLGEEGVIHGVNETEVNLIVASYDLLPKLKAILPHCPKVSHIIYFPDPLKDTDTSGLGRVSVMSFADVIQMGIDSSHTECLPSSDDVAIIMYTSGSTGTPKGVMLSHGNLTAGIKMFAPIMDAKRTDVYLSYLPLAHVLELLGESLMLMYGVPMGYSTALTLTDVSTKIKKGCKGDASILKPTVVPAVPLILDRIYKSAFDNASARGLVFRKLFTFFVNYRLLWMKAGCDTPICNSIVFKRSRNLLGGRVRAMGCGGAPLSENTHNIIRAILGTNVFQGYGLTETCASATMMDGDDYSTGRVGPPLSFSNVKLVDWEEGGYRITDKPNPRGEIIVGGKHIAIGYFKRPEATKECFYEMDGERWFRTGDIGEFYPNGTLIIIDRKKDLVKLQMGEYISMGKVESVLKLCAFVDNICICGDSSRMSVVAVISTTEKAMNELFSQLGKEERATGALHDDPEVRKAVLTALIATGKRGKLSKFEFPSACYLTSDTWTPDNNLVTATMKLKRFNIESTYKAQISRMYNS